MTKPELPKLSLNLIRGVVNNSIRIAKLGWAGERSLLVKFIFSIIALSATPFLIAGSRGFLINELVSIAGSGSFTVNSIVGLILFLIANVLQPLLGNLAFYVEKGLWFVLEEKFENLVIKQEAALDIAMHEHPEHSNLSMRIKEAGVWRINNFTSRGFYVAQNIFEAVIAGAILAVANWWLAVILIVAVVPAMLVEFRYGEYAWGIWTQNAEDRRKFFRYRGYFSHLPSLVEIKLFRNAGYFFERIFKLFRKWQNSHRESERRRFGDQMKAGFISQLTIALAGGWFVYEVIQGKLQIGTLTFFLAALGDFRQALTGMFANLGRQYSDSLFVSDVFKFLDLKPTVVSPAGAVTLPLGETPTIVFDNVSFAYPSGEVVLKNFSLTIRPGDKVALVGPNGAGKTTVVKLLCRFYDPTEGQILVNGHDLRKIDLESWYATLGLLFQDYMNYHLLVKEAIAVGSSESGDDMEKVKASAQAAEADVFIEEWEKKYEQQLAKQFTGGIEPSIGQWQKLALARTFYRNPRILVLDEPTSSIDAEAEASIFEKLEKLPKDRTVILISHRFSTVRHANQICVIEGGKLTENGTHEELLKLDKTYARLFKLQAKGYK